MSDSAEETYGTPHAFHLNLPPHHMDESDGIPYITKFAKHKARLFIELVRSIQLSERMFANFEDENINDMEMNEEDIEAYDEEDEEEVVESPQGAHDTSKETLGSVIKKCTRLLAQLSSLEGFKYGGITQHELCEILLHLLRLLTCTVTYEINSSQQRMATLHWENVGFIYKSPEDEAPFETTTKSKEELDRELEYNFALPAPAREVLLSVLINMLSNKGPLRSVSNASIYPQDSEEDRALLILHWHVLLRMLLRTAPYLDEHKVGKSPMDSNSRQNTILKRTVQLIRDARHFFDQGLRPNGSGNTDKTAKEIWDMVQSDILYHSHTHACYRGTIILYLFQPSRCTSDYYLKVMPLWFESWTNIDRCPEYDFLWLALFCRARKHISATDYDWGPVRRRLLTNAQYWLQLPIGGTTMDKSFPRVANPRSRSCPPRLKVFAGASSSYEEGIDFVAKVAKLLVTSIGTGQSVENDTKGGSAPKISEGTNDILRFLSFVTPYFNPSNLGSWTFTLGAFLHYFAYELCCRVGAEAGVTALKESHPSLVDAMAKAQPGTTLAGIPPHEIVALMDALLPLCQQALYSKNGHVGRAGEAAMLYLVQIDPEHTTPSFIDFASRALDISAVNLSHQAPSALSALTRLVQPALRSDPTILLARLPDILRLSLAGIDSNDQNKTIRTLILYRSLASWFPVGGSPETWPTIKETPSLPLISADGTMRIGNKLFGTLKSYRKSPAYQQALERLPETSLLRLGVLEGSRDPEMQQLLVEEAASAMSDWALEFLDRVFGLLRASGEREKAGKTSSGVASRHSSADVHQARNFSRVLKEALLQVFAGMNNEVHELAVRSVARFLEEETLPAASKDVSLLCQAVAAARSSGSDIHSPGLDALIPILTDDLRRHSTKTVVYRLRGLAGAVRSASHAVMKHRTTISEAIKYALSSDDRHVFKTGCKLLRHTLATLSESYPLVSGAMPRVYADESSTACLGRSAQLHSDAIQWHVPDGQTIGFASELLNYHVKQSLDSLSSQADDESATPRSKMLNALEVKELRRCLRVVRYSIRGGASILLDYYGDCASLDIVPVPYEKAAQRLLDSAEESVKASLLEIRGRLCSFLVVLSSVIASETLHPEAIQELPEVESYRKILPLISSDAKICKETSDIALLLLTRRGASFRSQEARTIWKAQKQLATDFSLCAQVDHMVESLQSASLYSSENSVLYKDGEDAGKTVPRRLLVARVQLFHDSLQRNASFEVPRRLRKLDRTQTVPRTILFSVKPDLNGTMEYLESLLVSSTPRALDAYEGIIDGLYALCCHSNTQVRASAISVVDYAMTRFGWLVSARVPRLLTAISLNDSEMNGKFGIPSCAALVDKVNQQGKRKRLAEAIKGVCSVLSLPRALKLCLGTDKARYRFAQTLCGTDKLIALLPAEEMQKIVMYLQSIFSPFRSKFYHLPRATLADEEHHESTLKLALAMLSEKKVDSASSDAPTEVVAVHWRKMLLAGWFLLSLVDGDDLKSTEGSVSSQAWSTCFHILESEMGQPLQRVSLGLLGKLLSMSNKEGDKSQFVEKMRSESFCKVLAKALVYDHKEDKSVGGGHDAQWSSGVEDIIRDASRHVAPRILFPFQRTSQSMGSFKISHCQLIETSLLSLDKQSAVAATSHFLAFSKELVAAPPSEDQRNQQITSAEIFAGVCGAFLRGSTEEELRSGWADVFLPHLEDAVAKIPFSLSGAYFDALRYALQFCSPSAFYPLTSWMVEKIQVTLWQPVSCADDVAVESEGAGTNGSVHGTEGFTAQSKWLYLFSSVLIEMDESDHDSPGRTEWYPMHLVNGTTPASFEPSDTKDDLDQSWNLVTNTLLQRLTEALGHPFDSCRDHISRCLFRICYGHRKRARISASRPPSMLVDPTSTLLDPGSIVVAKLQALEKTNGKSFKDRYNALSTARRYISYGVHLGEAKFEYSDYVIPLLPLAFETLDSTVEEEIRRVANCSQEENTAKRALEAEVIKAFRYSLAEVSVTAVISYGRTEDISRVLDTVEKASKHGTWQVRHAAAHFLRGFQGAHKFVFTSGHADKTIAIVINLLSDERREVSAAAMSALTGILAALTVEEVSQMVKKYALVAARSKMKRQKKGAAASAAATVEDQQALEVKERKRARNQQSSVFFLCAVVMSQPYETPSFVPEALSAISKHSFERNAPLGIRDTVKRCCAEYKKTHMSDNWELHRSAFSQEQLEALEDVVSSPHYYA